jgi:hypothetical protein
MGTRSGLALARTESHRSLEFIVSFGIAALAGHRFSSGVWGVSRT